MGQVTNIMKKFATITKRPENGIYKVLEINGSWVKLQDIKKQYLPFERLLKTVTFIKS